MNVRAKDAVLNLKYVLSTAFLSGVPTSRLLWLQVKQTLNALSEYLNGEDLISVVVQSTLQHPLSLQYPRNRTYVRSVLQWLKDVWDEYQWTGKDYLHFLQNDPSSVTAESLEIGYKSYSAAEEGAYITLLESYEGISRGTTGLSSWGAAQVLASWCNRNPEDIAGKNIVELGAGTGYTAVSILSSSAMDGPAAYTATDYHPHVLSILHHNLSLLHSPEDKSPDQLMNFCVDMNSKLEAEELPPGEFKFWKKNSGFMKGKTLINVQQLDWRNPSPDLPPCDVVLAADVVYAVHLFPDLAQIIRKLLSRSNQALYSSLEKKHKNDNMAPDLQFQNRRNVETRSKTDEIITNTTSECCRFDFRSSEKNEARSNPEFLHPSTSKAIVACTRRNQETVTEFLTELTNQGLSYKTVFQTTLEREGYCFAYDESYKPVKIFEIVL